MEREATPPKPSPRKAPPPAAGKSPQSSSSASRVSSGGSSAGSGVGGAVGTVSERLDMYKHAIQNAESAGEGSKVRRYKRSLATLEQVSLHGL